MPNNDETHESQFSGVWCPDFILCHAEAKTITPVDVLVWAFIADWNPDKGWYFETSPKDVEWVARKLGISRTEVTRRINCMRGKGLVR